MTGLNFITFSFFYPEAYFWVMKIQQVFENNSAVEITLVEWFIMWTWNDFISKKNGKTLMKKWKSLYEHNYVFEKYRRNLISQSGRFSGLDDDELCQSCYRIVLPLSDMHNMINNSWAIWILRTTWLPLPFPQLQVSM